MSGGFSILRTSSRFGFPVLVYDGIVCCCLGGGLKGNFGQVCLSPASACLACLPAAAESSSESNLAGSMRKQVVYDNDEVAAMVKAVADEQVICGSRGDTSDSDFTVRFKLNPISVEQVVAMVTDSLRGEINSKTEAKLDEVESMLAGIFVQIEAVATE